MNFVIGYAGIPLQLYDGIYKDRGRIAGDNCRFVSKPLAGATYTNSHATFFLREFAELIRADHHNRLSSTGFAIVYVDYRDAQTTAFVDAFFPATLAIPVILDMRANDSHPVERAKNRLVMSFGEATNRARKSLPVLQKELSERSNKTPLLLPIRNFRSNILLPELRTLAARIWQVQDKPAVIANCVRSVEHNHPPQRIGERRRRCFVDTRNVEFHPPGTARHAFARPTAGHPELCLLSGRRRLGAPYDPAFHYDCARGEAPLSGLFFGCHEPEAGMTGRPHINVSPNDHARI